MKEVKGFFEEYNFLSNFYLCEVIHNDRVFPSSEHAFMFSKLPDTANHDYAYALVVRMSPGQVKRWGRSITLREDWNDIRLRVMEEVVEAKFRDNPIIREKLLALEGYYLEETNSWNDRFWGVCRGEGENNLGKILMRVRDRLLLEQTFG